MSSSGSGEQRAQRTAPAEQHLGDRLAAFVDGELTDDARDRVLAHLATCPQCKAAATEQRRLKSVVAASGLPAISPGLLARLQGLANCGGEGDGPPGGPGAYGEPGLPRGYDPAVPGADGPRGPFDGGLLGSGVFGPGAGSAPGSGARREEFSYLAPARDLVAPGEGRGARGFRIHELARGLTGESGTAAARRAERQGEPGGSTAAAASRGRRLAFAAAGAFSMAAIAIGGALPMEAAVDGGARPDDGPAVTPFSANSVTDTRGTTPRDLLDAGEERLVRHARGIGASSVPPLGPSAASLTSKGLLPVAAAARQAPPAAPVELTTSLATPLATVLPTAPPPPAHRSVVPH